MTSIIAIFVVLFVVSSAEETSYDVVLPARGDDVESTATVTTNDVKKLIRVRINDVAGSSAGGISHIDFKNRLLVLLPTDRTRCNILNFPAITYGQAKQLLKTAPAPDGRLRGVYCIIRNIPAPYYSISEEAKTVCNVASGKVTVNKIEHCNLPEGEAQVKYEFSILSGNVDQYGLAAILGGNIS